MSEIKSEGSIGNTVVPSLRLAPCLPLVTIFHDDSSSCEIGAMCSLSSIIFGRAFGLGCGSRAFPDPASSQQDPSEPSSSSSSSPRLPLSAPSRTAAPHCSSSDLKAAADHGILSFGKGLEKTSFHEVKYLSTKAFAS